MIEHGPMLRIDAAWIPCEVLEEIPPQRPIDAGFLVIRTAKPPDDIPEGELKAWQKWGEKRLRVPAYQVYQYTARNDAVKPAIYGGKPLGQKDALADGSEAPFKSKRQTDQVVDLDKPGATPPGPKMGVGPTIIETGDGGTTTSKITGADGPEGDENEEL